MLVDGVALHRHAVPHGGDCALQPQCTIDDEELGTTQTALDEIIENRTLGLGGLTTHALDGEQ